MAHPVSFNSLFSKSPHLGIVLGGWSFPGDSLTISAIPSSWCISMWQWRNHQPGLSDMKLMTTYPPAGTITGSFLTVWRSMEKFFGSVFQLGLLHLFLSQPSLVQGISPQYISLLCFLTKPVVLSYSGYPTWTTWNVWPWRWIGWAAWYLPIADSTSCTVSFSAIPITWTH